MQFLNAIIPEELQYPFKITSENPLSGSLTARRRLLVRKHVRLRSSGHESGMMGNLKQKQTKQTEQVSNTELEPASSATTRRKKAGRPHKKPATKPEAGTGGPSLSCAIDSWVIDHTEELAKALGSHALKSTSGVKLLADLVGAKASQAKPEKKRPGLTLAQRLALEPPWKDPNPGPEIDYLQPKTPLLNQ